RPRRCRCRSRSSRPNETSWVHLFFAGRAPGRSQAGPRPLGGPAAVLRGRGAPMTITLASRGLTIRFGGHVAVNAVTAEFRAGELTAIVGPNGAGKTTYFNLLS